MTPRFLLFRASAGSGKTYNLAIQYIALLLAKGEHEYRYTLAVTFTNKATAEMKDRILQFLYDMWKGREGSEGKIADARRVVKQLYNATLSDDDIRQRSHRALSTILHDYSHFYVSTIDAFFQGVLRNMAHELGLNARLQVDLDDKAVIEIAVDNLMENLRHDNRDVLPWLTGYIEQQLSENKPWDVRRELKHMARILFEEEYLKRSIDSRNRAFNIENIGHFRQALEEEKKKELKPLTEAANAFENTMRNMGLDYEELFSYQADVHRYITNMKAGNTKATYGKRLSDMAADPMKLLKSPLRKEASLHPIAQQLAAQLDRISQIHQQAANRLGSIELALGNLTPMGLLGAIDNEVTRFSNERNRFMLARTPIMLRRMIQGEDASFVFERIGTQYHNIMIDEFQDTSRLQWENFRTLLLDNLASGGLSMIVGDIKQSIYRWRNGDWRILHELDRNGHNGIPLIHNQLDNNYRSLGQIVRFNNWLFPLAAQALDNLSSGNEGESLTSLYADVKQEIKRNKEGGYVRIHILHSKEKAVAETWEETMLADLCQQVESLHAGGVDYSDMTILLRKNKYIQPTIAYFAEHLPHVRLVSNEAFLLGSSVAIQMIVCALQVIDDMERDPVALYYLAEEYQRHVALRPNRIPPATADDYLKLLPRTFTDHMAELRNLPLYELCEKVYRVLGIEKIAERQDAFLFTFFDELSVYLRENPSDIPSFLQYWNEKMQLIPIPNGEVDGIRIYTIHKSKGLAFHTVLMPFADWDIERDMLNDLHWCMPTEAPLDKLGSLPIKFSSQKVMGTQFEKDYLEEHANCRADELNTLYVAFTRAKENLLVWGLSQKGLEKDKRDENIADLLYTVLKEEDGDEDGLTFTMGTPPMAAPQAQEGQTLPHTEGLARTITTTMCSYEGNLQFRQSGQAADFIRQVGEEEDEADESRLSYIEQGKLLHYVFSQIETADDIERITGQFAKQGILKSDSQLRQVRNLAMRGLRNERVRDWFSGRYQLFNECNILIPDPENEGKLLKKRPDRVMLSPQEIIIVDFKFGKPQDEYREQVAQYMEILQSMYPDRRVEGWLWYVYKNKVEQI